ncbi:sensor histidine kinase [Tellurirhabdus rosea]|uniref:sensor histidine kinase n=1 Tax=Tellurirhabdus rosea TaxID=2674997 RepID=UPI002256EF79|nr:histidine kinase [Tellurirhabdus rosea]
MTFQESSPIFLGMVLAMFLANGVQWFMYRERIYAIYTIYTLVWAAYFNVNHYALSYNIANFYKLLLSYSGYILYLELAKLFLNLRDRPHLLRAVKWVQWAMVFYCVTKTYVYLFTDFWQTPLHQILLQPVRFSLVAIGAYIVVTFIRSKDMVARFFVAGTAALLLNHSVALALLLRDPALQLQALSWKHPDFWIQSGVVLDLIFFALGISYRHRRESVRQALVLEREREQRHREQLEANLTLQQLKQEKTEAQMRALQSQINPHFLFNSLNTLSSLIEDSPQQAEDFVNELSSVYRYLLRSNEHELTTLGIEMSFIESYFHLLRTRFGNSVDLHIDISPADLEALLPPLTLQLLLENAVKHNIILPDHPLTIRIRTTEDRQLVMENNLQRKKLRVESNGVGLSNIAVKYRLLNQPAPIIEERDGWFRVTLPLLMPQPVAMTRRD